MKLYVGNLSFNTSNSDLQELFASVGTVESASVVEDRDTGRSRGFGFVEMSSKEEGDRAIDELDGMFALAIWDGRSARLTLARDRAGKKPLFVWRDASRVVWRFTTKDARIKLRHLYPRF